MCARRAWEREFYCKRKDRPADSVLRDLYGDTNKKVAGMKQGSMHADGFKEILDDFVPHLIALSLCARSCGAFYFLLPKPPASHTRISKNISVQTVAPKLQVRGASASSWCTHFDLVCSESEDDYGRS